MKFNLEITRKELAVLVLMFERFDTLIIEDTDIRLMVTAIMAPLYRRLSERLIGVMKRDYTIKLKPGEASALRYVLDRMHTPTPLNPPYGGGGWRGEGGQDIGAMYIQSLRDRLLWDIDKWFVNQDHSNKYCHGL